MKYTIKHLIQNVKNPQNIYKRIYGNPFGERDEFVKRYGKDRGIKEWEEYNRTRAEFMEKAFTDPHFFNKVLNEIRQ